MPLLKTEADKLTNPSLQAGIIEVIIDRGAPEIMRIIPFKSFEGESYAFVREGSIATGNSARDPYGTSIPSGGGSNVRHEVPAAMLIRNADTAKIDVIGKSDFNDLRRDDIVKEAKRLAQDFLYQAINGRVDETETVTSYNLRGWEHWLDKYVTAGFDEQYIDADGENLSLEMLTDLLSRQKGEQFDAIYMDRETWVKFRTLLENAPGNTAAMLMNRNFGMAMLHYDGIPVVKTDAVGVARTFDSATVDGTEVTVTDVGFLGFQISDEGNTLTLDGTDHTIQSVDGSHVVTVDGTPSAGSGSVEKVPSIWAARFDEVDGCASVYHRNRGVPANAGEYYGPIAGFDAEDLGLLEESPRYRTRLDWFGNTVVQSPYALAKLANFAL